MTAQSFCDWINNDLLPSSHLPPHFPQSISLRTAIRWLHHLGFKKGIYIGGHKHSDVVKHRKHLLKTLHDLRTAHKPPPLCSDRPPHIRQEEDEDKKEFVVIYTMMSPYSIPMRDRHGCEEKKNDWQFTKDKRKWDHGLRFCQGTQQFLRFKKVKNFSKQKRTNPNIVQGARQSRNMVRKRRVIGQVSGLWGK